jgi:transposase
MVRLGTSIRQFTQRFPNADECLHHVFQSRWGDHTVCPKCGLHGLWSRVKGRSVYRHDCGMHSCPLDSTIFYRSNLPLNLWFYALLLSANSSNGVRASFLRKQLGIGLRSSHRMASSIRWHLSSGARPKELGGPGKMVTIDEAQINNVTCRDRSRHSSIIMAIASEGQLICGIVPDRKKITLLNQIKKFVLPGSQINGRGIIH